MHAVSTLTLSFGRSLILFFELALQLSSPTHICSHARLAAKTKNVKVSMPKCCCSVGKWFDLVIDDITQSPVTASQHNNTISYVSQYIPLWVGIADLGSPQAEAVSQSFLQSGLIQPGGIATSTYNSTQQWDFPNCWAPLQARLFSIHLKLCAVSDSALCLSVCVPLCAGSVCVLWPVCCAVSASVCLYVCGKCAVLCLPLAVFMCGCAVSVSVLCLFLSLCMCICLRLSVCVSVSVLVLVCCAISHTLSCLSSQTRSPEIQ